MSWKSGISNRSTPWLVVIQSKRCRPFPLKTIPCRLWQVLSSPKSRLTYRKPSSSMADAGWWTLWAVDWPPFINRPVYKLGTWHCTRVQVVSPVYWAPVCARPPRLLPSPMAGWCAIWMAQTRIPVVVDIPVTVGPDYWQWQRSEVWMSTHC